MCLFSITSVRAQDDTYYTDDQSSVTVKAQQAPPPLPDYVQPVCPGDGYLWVPGYWSWTANGYYWVPGVWVIPPSVNLLWTPGYWGFYGSFYGWHPGYWGPYVGYYGGVNYGFGYFGTGFYGGRWEGGHFSYNTSVWRVGKGFHNTYADRPNVPDRTNHASFNGPEGVHYRPGNEEAASIRQDHVPANRDLMQHEQNMAGERGQFQNIGARPDMVHSMSAPGGQRFDQGGRSMGMGGMGAAGGRGGGGGGGGRR